MSVSLLSKEENKTLIEKYPFLIPRNRFSGEVVANYDYEYTELDNMPIGWRIAFGEQLCEELAEELIANNCLESYRITDIKEKWGGLRWYDFGCTEKGHEIIHKYEKLSESLCIRCGNKSEGVTSGWISPFCQKCADELQLDIYPLDEEDKNE